MPRNRPSRRGSPNGPRTTKTPPQRSPLLKWHGNDPELVEITHRRSIAALGDSPRRHLSKSHIAPHLLPESARREPLALVSPADPRAVRKELEVERRVRMPAIPENRDCRFNAATGELRCKHRNAAPATECRRPSCPHVAIMRTRLRKRLRQYAPEVRRAGELYLLRTDTVE